MNEEKELLCKEFDLKFKEFEELIPRLFDLMERSDELNSEETKVFKELEKKQSALNSEMSKILKKLKKL